MRAAALKEDEVVVALARVPAEALWGGRELRGYLPKRRVEGG